MTFPIKLSHKSNKTISSNIKELYVISDRVHNHAMFLYNDRGRGIKIKYRFFHFSFIQMYSFFDSTNSY